ncbi:hypothetical protein OnM2_012025 [Erysiphe neolycopersici]|uniref:Uncharacterized protein n=1 Tax=Erysiphe neolycopersici TaxID=212602 RepID=A0A420I640_9PEZI|nr:hypothetical protein OnM2_012025 [Erysiphe neolycopersici]
MFKVSDDKAIIVFLERKQSIYLFKRYKNQPSKNYSFALSPRNYNSAVHTRKN